MSSDFTDLIRMEKKEEENLHITAQQQHEAFLREQNKRWERNPQELKELISRGNSLRSYLIERIEGLQYILHALEKHHRSLLELRAEDDDEEVADILRDLIQKQSAVHAAFLDEIAARVGYTPQTQGTVNEELDLTHEPDDESTSEPVEEQVTGEIVTVDEPSSDVREVQPTRRYRRRQNGEFELVPGALTPFIFVSSGSINELPPVPKRHLTMQLFSSTVLTAALSQSEIPRMWTEVMELAYGEDWPNQLVNLYTRNGIKKLLLSSEMEQFRAALSQDIRKLQRYELMDEKTASDQATLIHQLLHNHSARELMEAFKSWGFDI